MHNVIQKHNDTTSLEKTTFSSKKEAVIFLQKKWRRYIVMKKFKNPSDTQMNNRLNPLPIGNDPISHIENHFKIKKHPAIVTAGGAQCLRSAINLTMKPNNQLGDKPKIFLMDCDASVLRFWKLLTQAFNNSPNIESFLGKMPIFFDHNPIADTYNVSLNYPENMSGPEKYIQWLVKESTPYEEQKKLINGSDLYKDLTIDDYHPWEHFKYFYDLFDSDNDRFIWIKKVVTNQLCLIKNCWLESIESFEFIKNVCDYHGYEICVYASNIDFDDDIYKRRLYSNIKLLSPSIIVRTKNAIEKNSDDTSGVPIVTEYIKGNKIDNLIDKYHCLKTTMRITMIIQFGIITVLSIMLANVLFNPK